MKNRITSLAHVFRNALLAPPDGRLLRRSAINALLAVGGSALLAGIANGVAALMGISVEENTPNFEIGAMMFIFVVIVGPLVETLLLAGLFLVMPRRLGVIKRAIISAILWGGVHALSAPLWFFGTVFSFFVFSCSYLTWRKKSFAHGFLAAMLPHIMVNLFACTLLAIAAILEEPMYRAMAEQGDMEAQYKLGERLCRNAKWAWVVSEDEDVIEAMTWFRKAAEQGHSEAQWKLGHRLYCYGWYGVEQDMTERLRFIIIYL